jgi:hypothetical protein
LNGVGELRCRTGGGRVREVKTADVGHKGGVAGRG